MELKWKTEIWHKYDHIYRILDHLHHQIMWVRVFGAVESLRENDWNPCGGPLGSTSSSRVHPSGASAQGCGLEPNTYHVVFDMWFMPQVDATDISQVDV